MTRARITSKGQITIPKRIREQLGVEPGDALEFHFEDGRLEVRPIHGRRLAEFRGLFSLDRALPFAEERARARAARVEALAHDNESAHA